MKKSRLFGALCVYLFALTTTPVNGAAFDFTTLPYNTVEDISDDGTILSRGDRLVVLPDGGTVSVPSGYGNAHSINNNNQIAIQGQTSSIPYTNSTIYNYVTDSFSSLPTMKVWGPPVSG